jgi:hypothetical protein
MGESGAGREEQTRADAQLSALLEGLAPHEAALRLAVLINRAAVRLHTLGRSGASARKGQPSWPAWAQLQNAARTLVLQSSTCRDLAARLSGPGGGERDSGGPA